MDKYKSRPDLLTVLCILTFIGSGMMFLSNVMYALNYELFQEWFIANEDKFPGASLYLSVKRGFSIWNSFLYLGSLIGAILMFKLKKAGFHIYTSSQIFLLIVSAFYIKLDSFPLMGLLTTLIFVLLYHKNIKYMQ